MARPREPKILRIETLTKVGRMAIHLAEKTLTWRQTKESWIHGVVLGLLEAFVGDMQSQYSVNNGRIDFRHGGPNPDAIELVVRFYGTEHYGNMNADELRKLSRIPFSRARKCILLILDASGQKATPKENLRSSYSRVRLGRGRFHRREVTVMYVHPKTEYNFRWNPYRT